MKKLLLLLLLLSSCQLKTENQKEEGIYKKIFERSVIIINFINPQNSYMGTGTILGTKNGSTYILSVDHVCRFNDVKNNYIKYNDKLVRVETVATNADLDLCLLKFKTDKIYFNLRLNKKDTFGSVSYGLGGSLAGKFRIEHRFLKFRQGDIFEGLEMLYGEVNPGDSGTGIFNEDFQLQGVVDAKFIEIPLGIAIPVKSIDDFLSDTEYMKQGK